MDSFEREAERVSQHILGELADRQAGEDHGAKEAVPISGVQLAQGRALATLEPLDEPKLVRRVEEPLVGGGSSHHHQRLFAPSSASGRATTEGR